MVKLVSLSQEKLLTNLRLILFLRLEEMHDIERMQLTAMRLIGVQTKLSFDQKCYVHVMLSDIIE